MSRLTKEDILKFPMTVYGRAIGKQLSAQVISELLKYKQLEEDLGCPLNVRCKVVCDSYIYDENGIKYEVVYVYEDHFDCEDPFDNDMGYTKLCAFEWKDYKQDWFLKEDKSE